MARTEKVIMTNMCMVFSENRVLVQDKTDDDYSGITFPGGHVERGESFTDSQFVMEYKIFNTTDEQSLLLESGDIIRTEVIVDSGKLSIKIQKDSDTPIYERDDIVTSENFDVEIQESGTYKITVIGENTKGGVSFKKVDGEKAEQEETQQGISEKTIDLSGAFQEINGCAVIYSPVQEEYSFFNEDMCRQEVSPYSTFKIISALLGLQKGVIVDESSTMGYDGMDYGNAEWNGDLTLEEAFQNSCIWYFREVIDLVGKNKMQEELKNLQYGNCDISEWQQYQSFGKVKWFLAGFFVENFAVGTSRSFE